MKIITDNFLSLLFIKNVGIYSARTSTYNILVLRAVKIDISYQVSEYLLQY